MSTLRSVDILPRQVLVDNGGLGWWYGDEAYIVKWIIIAVIVALFLIFVVGGYFHAQRRMKKGLQPLPYHRWLISRRQRERWFPQQTVNNYGYYRQGQWSQQPHGQSYPMQPWGPAPPAYQEPEHVPPYAPPQGSSKVNPDQSYTAPLGPPPPAVAHGTVREVDDNTGNGNREDSGLYSPNAGPSQTFIRNSGHGNVGGQSTYPKY